MSERLKTFQEVLAAAVADMAEWGFDSQDRVDRWTRELRLAAERSMISPESLEQQLREGLAAQYRRLVDGGGIARYHKGVDRFTLERIRPQLRSELDRRIAASANLIKLNRTEAVDKTLRRFQGWSTSIPVGGVSGEKKSAVKAEVRKSLASLPFEERRVLIDQGHKLIGAINQVVATDGGAIAGIWRSHWRQPGYNYRPDHKDRDEEVYLVRDSWAHQAGLVKKGGVGYYDEVTAVGQEPFCFPGDSQVQFADGIEKAYRRHFRGAIVILQTTTGRELRATPNHPILTTFGWLPAGAINEGDYVIEIADQRSDAVKNNHNKAIPTLAEIFVSLSKLGGTQSTREGKLHQFHGDGSDGDVDIVNATRRLSIGTKSKLGQGAENLYFPIAFSMETARRAVHLFARGCFRASALIMRGFRQALSPSLAFASHSYGVGSASSADSAACLHDDVADDLSRYLKFAGEDQNALASFMPKANAVRVVSVERTEFSGHIYNLQTRVGWYSVNGIIAHNCRCYMIWLYNLRDLPADMLTAKGKDALASVQGAEEVRAARTGRADEASVAYSDARLNVSNAGIAHLGRKGAGSEPACSQRGAKMTFDKEPFRNLPVDAQCKKCLEKLAKWDEIRRRIQARTDGTDDEMPDMPVSRLPVPVDRDKRIRTLTAVADDGLRLYVDRSVPRVADIGGKVIDPASIFWERESAAWIYGERLTAVYLENYGRSPSEDETKEIAARARIKGDEAEAAAVEKHKLDADAWAIWKHDAIERITSRRGHRRTPVDISPASG